MPVSESFKGWVAGFTDGDGSISIHKQAPSSKHGLVHTAYYIAVQFTNTEKKALEAIRAVYKGQIGSQKSEWGEYPVYHLVVVGYQGARLLRDIYPHLVLKKEHARLCLELVDTISRFKCYGPRIPEFEWQHRKSLYYQLRVLNRRGKDREKCDLLERFYPIPQLPLLLGCDSGDWSAFPYSESEFRCIIEEFLVEQEDVNTNLAEEISQGLVGKSQNIWDAVRVARLEPSLGVRRAIELLLPG